MHTQELAENIPDMAHFNYVHEVGTDLRAEFEIDGHVYRQRSLMVVDDVPVEFTSQEAQRSRAGVAAHDRPNRRAGS